MANLITRTVLNPLVTAPLLLLFTQAPEQVREPILDQLRQHVSTDTITKAITALRWLTGLGLARWLHNSMNELAQNNFRLRSEKHRYYWPKEIAVITGAAGGFGSLMAKDLATKGIAIIAIDITEDLPKDMQNDPRIHYYRCDITSKDAVDAMAQDVKEKFGNPSILINNAGVAFNHTITNASASSLQKIFGVNILSHYYMCQAFLPAMLQQKKGHVVTIASMASFVTPAGMVSYSNTKSAALSFHEGLQSEARVVHNAPEVKFTVVHPNFAATGMVAPYADQLKKAGMSILRPEVVSDAVVKQILSGRGRQILVPENEMAVSLLRALPFWLTQPIMRIAERNMPKDTLGQGSG